MRSSLILSFAGALMASSALADDGASFVKGDWIGMGAFQLGDEISACSEVKMRFEGSKTGFEVHEASMTCGNAPKQEFTAFAYFTVDENGILAYDRGTAKNIATGTHVGVVKDNKLHMVNPVEGDNVDDIHIQKAGDLLIYDQRAGEPGQTPDYSLLAIMKRDPSAAPKP